MAEEESWTKDQIIQAQQVHIEDLRTTIADMRRHNEGQEVMKYQVYACMEGVDLLHKKFDHFMGTMHKKEGDFNAHDPAVEDQWQGWHKWQGGHKWHEKKSYQ